MGGESVGDVMARVFRRWDVVGEGGTPPAPVSFFRWRDFRAARSVR